jgi:hypothetical protein
MLTLELYPYQSKTFLFNQLKMLCMSISIAIFVLPCYENFSVTFTGHCTIHRDGGWWILQKPMKVIIRVLRKIVEHLSKAFC